MRNMAELKTIVAGQPISFGKRGELDTIRVENRFASFEMTFHGAHVTSYTPRGGRDLLWMSKESNLAPGKPIRGGVPICWPWFGPHPAGAPYPAHGYARLARWDLLAARTLPTGETRLLLRLDRAAIPPEIPQMELEAEFAVTIGNRLELELTTYNVSDSALTVTEALHSYFAVADIAEVMITGLEATRYLDKVAGDEKVGTGPVSIDREVDRIYFDTAATVAIDDRAGNRRITVAKHNSRSTVVWNPWIEKARKLPDFGDDEYRTMVCVETVHAASDRREVAPGGRLILKTVFS